MISVIRVPLFAGLRPTKTGTRATDIAQHRDNPLWTQIGAISVAATKVMLAAGAYKRDRDLKGRGPIHGKLVKSIKI